MKNKLFSVLFVLLGLYSSSQGAIDMKAYLQSQGITPTNNTYNVDLKPYIQAALNTDDVRFSGSGSVGSPLIYTTTAGVVVPEGTITKKREMIIAPDAMIKRLPSEGSLIELRKFTKLYCDSINFGGNMANALKGRIDGNKAAHWPDFPENGIGDRAVVVNGTGCLVQKIYVFDNCGTGFKTIGYNNNSIIEYCKAENCGYLDLKFGVDYYHAENDRYSGDGFDTSYSGGLTVRHCESIDAQRWDLLSAEEGQNNTFEDCTGKDINFRTFGFTDFEGTWGGNKLIRCSNAGGGSNGEGAQYYYSNMNSGAIGDSLSDCDLAGTVISLTCKFPNASINNVNAESLRIGKYLYDGDGDDGRDLTISGTLSLTDSVYIANGSFVLNQNGGTIDIDNDIKDEAGYHPVDGKSYFINQNDNGIVNVGGQMILGYRQLITGNYTINNSVLNFKGLDTDAKLVCGRQGRANIILNNSNITEDDSKAVPMVVRWFASGDGSLSGSGTVGLTGWFVNNGKVTADGGDLDLSSFASVNTIFSSNQSLFVFKNGYNGYAGTRDTSIIGYNASTVDQSAGGAESVDLYTTPGGAGKRAGFIGFDNIFACNAGQILSDAVITNAKLRIYVFSTNPTGNDRVDLHPMLTPWAEGDGAFWTENDGASSFNHRYYRADGNYAAGDFWGVDGNVQNGPVCNVDFPGLWDSHPLKSLSKTVDFAAAGSWMEFDVTDVIKAWQDGTIANNGWYLYANDYWNRLEFYSSEYMASPERRPELIVETDNGNNQDIAPEEIENISDNGWYAINHGKLLLPLVGVNAGDSSVTWGESQSDTEIDLVNSARIDFTNASTGLLDVSLLARDRIEARGSNAIGVWDVSFNGAFTSAQLSFRYDNALAGDLGIDESDLRLFMSKDGSWVDVTDSVDIQNNIIVSSEVSEFSIFVVGVLPSSCGDEGTFYLQYDLSGPAGVPDCYVDIFDFAEIANKWLCVSNCFDYSDLNEFILEWLDCTDPANENCF